MGDGGLVVIGALHGTLRQFHLLARNFLVRDAVEDVMQAIEARTLLVADRRMCQGACLCRWP